MRWFALVLFLFFAVPAAAQVDVSDDSADVGAPGRYYLNQQGADPNTAQVGRPYYYYPYYGYPYGAYRPGVQAVPDANDPNAFPMDALTNQPTQGGKVVAPKKKAAPPQVQTVPY